MLKRLIKVLCWLFVTWLFIRCFLFQAHRIPSQAMNGSLFEGEYVVINKLAYGARLPLTPLSVNETFVDWISLPYIRIFGYSDIKRNDIVAFNFSPGDELPVDLRERHVKRCIGLPGDTVKIVNGSVFINGTLSETGFTYNSYTIVLNKNADTSVFKTLGIIRGSLVDEYTCKVDMSTEQSASLLKSGAVKSITLDFGDNEIYQPEIFPNNPRYKWNADNMGPLYIPREDDSIALNADNLVLYKQAIERFENVKLTSRGDSVFANNSYKKYYTFNQDYYFFIGDNRHNSNDSRNWGFIPESHIIGKISMIVYSKKEGRSFSLAR